MSLLHTRRDFFAKSSLIVAATALTGNHLRSMTARDLNRTGDMWHRPAVSLDNMRALADAAMSAAVDAGASYADIRIVDEQTLKIALQARQFEPRLAAGASWSYGIRVLIGGAWSFVYGRVASVDHVVASARIAAERAQRNAATRRHTIKLAPTPLVDGEWSSPMEILPFSVPLRDQVIQLGVFNKAMIRVPELSPFSTSTLGWRKSLRVFASSEGTRTAQRLTYAEPWCSMDFRHGSASVQMIVPGFQPMLGGYETVLNPSLLHSIALVAQEGARIVRLPQRSLDVGRYPVAMVGRATGKLMGQTIAPALELDRALGHETDAAGTSYLAPPQDILASQSPLFSPLVTIVREPRAPLSTEAKWDDEGVEPTLAITIDKGVVKHYFSNRETAPILNDVSSGPKMTPASTGCSVAASGDSPPTVTAGHLALQESSRQATLDMFTRSISNGILMYSANVQPEPGLATGFLHGGGLVVQKGQVVARLAGSAVLFKTKHLWGNAIEAIGDSTTVESGVVTSYKGYPWASFTSSSAAPAALFKDIDVIRYGGLRT